MRRNDKPLNPTSWPRHGLIACALVIVSLSGCRARQRKTSSEIPPPNASVLLITLDTTRADHLSCYAHVREPRNAAGGKSARPASAASHFANTPNLDSLAARGVLFAHAIAQVPLTVPSHTCILTGTYPTMNHVRGMSGFVLSKSIPTIATLTQAARFATGAVLGSAVLNRTCGLNHGFETYDDHIAERRVEKLAGYYSKRPASVVTDHAIRWLELHNKARFFLWVHYYDPHFPYSLPAPFKGLYASDPYSGEIAYMDQEIGRLLGWIKQHGLDSRTLVLVIGDHGEGLGEHGERFHGTFLYDSTLHVPLIMAGPGVPSGKVIQQQVRSIDLMPTVAAYLHLSPGSDVQGEALWPLILHQRRVATNYAYCETFYPRTFMRWSELRAMHTEDWAFIVAPHPELYNLQADPGETANVYARHAELDDELEARIRGVVGAPNPHKDVSTVPVSPAERSELESLGYVDAEPTGDIDTGTKAPDPKDYIDVLEMVEKAEALLDEGSYPAAAVLMEKALRRDPANPAVHLYLATALDQMGEYQRAIAVYQHAVKMKLGNDEIYSRLGKAYLRLHELNRAAAAMARAAELNPNDVDNMCRLGNVDLQLGRRDGAQKVFEAAIARSDRFGPAYNGLGLIAVTRGDAESARQDFLRAMEVDPADMESLFNLGVLYQKTGNSQQALRYLELFVQKASPRQYPTLLPRVRAAIREMRRQP